MEEASHLNTCCRYIASILNASPEDEASGHLNEVVARFKSLGLSLSKSPTSEEPDFEEQTAYNIHQLYGDSFYVENEFRRLSSACASSLGDSTDIEEGWSKLRFVISSSLLHPGTSSDVIKGVPDVALSILVESMDHLGLPNDFILERLTLLWRLRNDLRLKRKVREYLDRILRLKEIVEKLYDGLSKLVDAPEERLMFKIKMFRFLSEILKSYSSNDNLDLRNSMITKTWSSMKDLLSVGKPEQEGELSDLHIVIPTPRPTTFPLNNIVHIGNRISYLRSTSVVQNDGFVNLKYSYGVLSSMLCHLDVSMGSVVSGENCKEFYIRELAHRVGVSHDRISLIYTEENTDVKTLIGQWICTDKVGEFSFNYGILTTAMREGRWLVFDDNLPHSIGCLLYRICQQGQMTIPELNETVEASSDFHFFITAKNELLLTGNLKQLPVTRIPALSEDDCIDIVCSRYISVRSISKPIVSAFFALRDSLQKHKGFNMSDLFKIANRLDTCGHTFDGYLSSSTKGVILEAFYCVLLAGISCDQTRQSILGDLADYFGVSRTYSYEMLPLNQITDRGNTQVHLKVLHQLMSCYLCNEPVILVGETGCGKTAVVQHFAKITGNTLRVYVFSEQSEAEDLIGSFFPDNIPDICSTLSEKTMSMLLRCCVVDDELLSFLDHVVELFRKGLYHNILGMLAASLAHITLYADTEINAEISILRKECSLRVGNDVHVKPPVKLNQLQQPLDSIPKNYLGVIEKYRSLFKSSAPKLHFKFEEGLLIQAMREGHWILLDEINLAPSDLLQRFVGIISKTSRTFDLYECGNRVIQIHENFRIFACMNPPLIRKGEFVTFTSGKKELPPNFRSHMTEIFVDAVDTIEDISIVVASYADKGDRSIPSDDICHFYHRVLEMCYQGELEDGSFKSPTFTLRNLVRTIRYMQHVMKRSHRAVKDGREAFADAALSCFASSLGPASFSNVSSLLPSTPSRASTFFEECTDYVRIEGYWIRRGGESIHKQEDFIVTPNIQKSIRRICRVLSGLRVPVLLEGPTASGKTSLVQYISELTGHKCIRINNHEHTDLSEYIGQFVFDSTSGRLRFNYGPIVTAMREGHWVILDELNLAPSQILEALNRILDDNREIYVPETGETIQSHPEFMIFATQNPANSIYGGRKQLSKAFCNRFVQLYIDGLDKGDLQQVLHQRCHIPLSRAEKIVATFEAIKSCPMNSMAFERHSVLITLRDLIKWANRVRDDDEGLAYYGWCVIAEKLRNHSEKEAVKEILERCCLLSKPSKPKQLSIDFDSDPSLCKFLNSMDFSRAELCAKEHYLWFERSTSRLIALILRALENNEPVLLVGDTGIGKTTICQLLAKLQGRALNILNLSKNSEASDFIGSFRPIRGLTSFHNNLNMLIEYLEDDARCPELVEYLKETMAWTLAKIDPNKFTEILELISALLETDTASDKEERQRKRQKMTNVDHSQLCTVISNLRKAFSSALFEWVDGPLVRSMSMGEWFLADEISLAEDAVLEKMNSVLETPSTITIPEAGGDTLRVIVGHQNFRFLATMNPSGDHGKRELSPALLNRFTVIYIPTPEFETVETLKSIMHHYCQGLPEWIAQSMADIISRHNSCCPNQKLTLRDIIRWAELMSPYKPMESFLNGAHVVFLDNMRAGAPGISLKEVLEIVAQHNPEVNVNVAAAAISNNDSVTSKLKKLPESPMGRPESYSFQSKNSLNLVAKLMRALEINRPILLEGEPGVGKSATISALAALNGVRLLRVNLSEHTDIMDLFGSDLPTIVDGNWKFIWHNGPVMEAAVKGHWIVLDELNLASQQVLEGLNALLDHRRETFIPELDRFIKCHDNFRLFASQNSATDGGGRKHLPKSFLNRFTKIYCQPLEEEDYCQILSQRYTSITSEEIKRIVSTLLQIKTSYCDNTCEYNLRDCMRFCDALSRGVPSKTFEDVFRFVFMSRTCCSLQCESMLRMLCGHGDNQIRIVPKYEWKPDISCSADEGINGEMSNNMDVDDKGDYAIGVNHAATSVRLLSTDSIWMQSQEEVHQSVFMAAHLNFPILLVGDASTGKQSIVRCVANRCEQPLVEFAMLPCFDTGDLLGGFEQVGTHETGDSSSTFRWVDSPVVSAIENGNWLLVSSLHNANPAILDRFNPILEVGGAMALNESGDCNRIIKPHPNFRIFMTADARHVGRISRAFRNRCMEIHIDYPSAIRSIVGNPITQFMEVLTNQISETMLRAGIIQDSLSDQIKKLEFDCSTVMDGARLARSMRKYSWKDSLTMSICNCILEWYMREFQYGAYSHHKWPFLKQWCMSDQPIYMTAKEISQTLPQDIKDNVLMLLECCLDWCKSNIHTHASLILMTNFLVHCNDFEDILQRDMAAAGLYKQIIDVDSALWFMSRSTEFDYGRRYCILSKLIDNDLEGPALNRLIKGFIRCDNPYEMQSLFEYVVFDGMKAHEQFVTVNGRRRFFEKMICNEINEETREFILSKMQLASFLLTRKLEVATVTVTYIVQRIYRDVGLLMDINVDLCSREQCGYKLQTNSEFSSYTTVLIGSPICCDLDVILDLHRYGMDRFVPSHINIAFAKECNVTKENVMMFISSYMASQDSDSALNKSLNCRVSLNMRQTETENTAITKFMYDRIKFLGSWVCHHFLVDDICEATLMKVHEYAMELLEFYVEMQKDIPSSCLAVIISVLMSLRRLLLDNSNHSWVYQILLDTWSLHIRMASHVEMNQLAYMANLISGHELGVGDQIEPDSAYKMDALDETTSVMLFWKHISEDNCLPSLYENIKRIESLRRMLSESIPIPHWSGLFTTLTMLSTVFSRGLNMEESVVNNYIRSHYSAIIRDERITLSLVDEVSTEDFNSQFKESDDMLSASTATQQDIIRILSHYVATTLSKTTESSTSGRIMFINDLWRMCGILLLIAMPNMNKVVEEVYNQLDREHRETRRDTLEIRLESYATMETLSDGMRYMSYDYLKKAMESLVSDKVNSSLRHYEAQDDFAEALGKNDTIALLRDMQHDLFNFLERTLKLTRSMSTKCDCESLVNFRGYLLKKYVVLPEVLRPVIMGIECLFCSISGSIIPTKNRGMLPSATNSERIVQRCLQYPYNILKHVNTGDLISLSATVYDSKGVYDLHCYIKCLLTCVDHECFHQTSMEPLKYAVLLLSGIASRLKMEREEGQEMRLSLLQACMAMAQKSAEKGVHDLLPSQKEIIRTIIRDCGPMDEYETLDDEEEPIEEADQNRQLNRITILCRMITREIQECRCREHVETACKELFTASELPVTNGTVANTKEDGVANQMSVTNQINSALCLAIACGADGNSFNQFGDITLLARRLMIGSEEFFGYRVKSDAAELMSFYKTVDLPSCMAAWDKITRLKAAVGALLTQFDGQQQLLDIDSMLNSISKVKLPNVTKVLLVTLLENLVARVHKWDAIAHSGISLREITVEIETLILELRRTELKGWYMAINNRIDSLRHAAYGYLVYFMEMCSHMHDAKTPLQRRITQSVKELVNFTVSAPIAHFEPILDMLRATVFLYRDTSNKTEIAMRSALENVLCFLQHWKPEIKERINSMKLEAHREVNELVKRINWSGTDYVSIHAMVNKQKAQLSSIMHRFQNQVAQPWSMVFSTSPMQHCVTEKNYNEQTMRKKGEDNITDVIHNVANNGTSILECLRSNIDYVRSNKSDLSRVQITRITREVEKELTEHGYPAAKGHDLKDWLCWIDFSSSMRSNGCLEAEDACNKLMLTLHVMFNLNDFFNKNKDILDFFNRNVDVNIFGHLVTMLRAVQCNIAEDASAFEKHKADMSILRILQKGNVKQIDKSSFKHMLSILDDIYEGALQANDKELMQYRISVDTTASSQKKHFRDNDESHMIRHIFEFRKYIENSEEFHCFKINDGQPNILVSGDWLLSWNEFCKDLSKVDCYSLPIMQFFHEKLIRLSNLLALAIPLEKLPVTKPKEFLSKNGILPQACLYLSQLIEAIAHVEPPHEEREQDSKEEWSAGTGLEDGTGAKNVSEDVNPEDGMFDNFKNENAPEHGDMSAENPSLDVDMEFEGDVLDLEDAKETSDIEEDENPGHNDEYDDLMNKQLDEDMVDEEQPLDNSGEALDTEGVSMGDTKDATEQNEGKQSDEHSCENDYTSEVEKQPHKEEDPTTAAYGNEEIETEKERDSHEESEQVPTGSMGNEMELQNEMDGEEIHDQEIDDNDIEESGDGQMDGMEEEGDTGEEGAETMEMKGHEKETDEGDDGVEPEGREMQGKCYPLAPNDELKRPLMSDIICPREGTTRNEYEETPYGTEGPSGESIRQEEKTETGGNSYEENTHSGSFWGDTSRNSGGMLSFLDMIQRLEHKAESSTNKDLKLKSISESITDVQNLNEHESTHNELDENSNMEGLSGSKEGAAAPNVDIDMTLCGNNQDRIDVELSEAVDSKQSKTEHLADTEMITGDNDVTMDVDEEDILPGSVDTSGVLYGTSDISMSDPHPDDLPSLANLSRTFEVDEASKKWRRYREETIGISTTLCEQMRMILDPTLNSSLQGDYKTGKRISIRKLMAFIASNYQRDKIWLRRSKPSKRDYRVVLAIDNSKSMEVSSAGTLALKAFACIYQAMSVLEIGKLSVCKYGGNVPELLLEMDGGEDPSGVVAGMTFDEESRHSHETGLPELLKFILHYLEKREERRKIAIIISDGKFNKEKARPWIQATISNQIVPLFVILDPLSSSNKSILQMKHVREIDGVLTVETFLSNLPFPYYAVIQNLDRLPHIISDLLRQWFALSNQR
ncbi:hypothetical protein BgAZ_107870 [Babesia gibsoni]|uniref:Midasin n=1 Tax=Babesia gibsoni TaxID=33632 RepID=A0AAD8UTU9_BABGI|nr:hypothetical protein BgAZ_107870 [Babesia gibsoni]